jgi:anthranilate phosphoribosyltransferase
MAINQYIKEIGRGKEGARSLTRAQAADLFGQVLDGEVTDLEIGGFCLAMRIKGETPEEMAGFLDATGQRLNRVPSDGTPVVVIPSYNGARKLPGLAPLLGLLLAKRGLRVLMHGVATETSRVYTSDVLLAMGIKEQLAIKSIANGIAEGELMFTPTALLCPGLQRLLDVRRVVGLRNPAHSLVKLMNPVAGASLLVSSYTHPEYALSMAATFELMQSNALLLRGTEGESVADPRRVPQMDGFIRGQRLALQAAQVGTLTHLPDLPKTADAPSTVAYIQAVLAGKSPVPTPIALQVEHILRLMQEI